MLQMSTNGFGQCGKRNKGARERERESKREGKGKKRWSNMNKKGRGGRGRQVALTMPCAFINKVSLSSCCGENKFVQWRHKAQSGHCDLGIPCINVVCN